LFACQEDKELARVMLQAYNDWHIDEWCGSYPGRFIPLALPTIWDPKLMADEVRRVAKKGCHTMSFTEDPQKFGYPSIHSEHWDPFWQACDEEGTVVAIHIGSGGGMNFTSMDAPVDVMISVTPMSIANCAADLVWSRMLRKYPNLKIALSEGGIGWIPYFLERVDYVYKSTNIGPTRTSATSCRATSFESTSSRASSTTRSVFKIATRWGSTPSPGSAITHTPIAPGRARPRSSGRASPVCRKRISTR
jgi:predicted TIM-barrel fold metal-dependent hydrolase